MYGLICILAVFSKTSFFLSQSRSSKSMLLHSQPDSDYDSDSTWTGDLSSDSGPCKPSSSSSNRQRQTITATTTTTATADDDDDDEREMRRKKQDTKRANDEREKEKGIGDGTQSVANAAEMEVLEKREGEQKGGRRAKLLTTKRTGVKKQQTTSHHQQQRKQETSQTLMRETVTEKTSGGGDVIKRGRGRPRKNPTAPSTKPSENTTTSPPNTDSLLIPPATSGRGRPSTKPADNRADTTPPKTTDTLLPPPPEKTGRGRPRKNTTTSKSAVATSGKSNGARTVTETAQGQYGVVVEDVVREREERGRGRENISPAVSKPRQTNEGPSGTRRDDVTDRRRSERDGGVNESSQEGRGLQSPTVSTWTSSLTPTGTSRQNEEVEEEEEEVEEEEIEEIRKKQKRDDGREREKADSHPPAKKLRNSSGYIRLVCMQLTLGAKFRKCKDAMRVKNFNFK